MTRLVVTSDALRRTLLDLVHQLGPALAARLSQDGGIDGPAAPCSPPTPPDGRLAAGRAGAGAEERGRRARRQEAAGALLHDEALRAQADGQVASPSPAVPWWRSGRARREPGGVGARHIHGRAGHRGPPVPGVVT
jgi:hypothetical protein